MTENPNRYCLPLDEMVPTIPPSPDTASRGFIVDNLKWSPFDRITIRFLGGHPSLQARVRTTAEEWLQHANLVFDWRNSGPADIRIAFNPGGSWSYLGKVCRQIPEPQPTMNYGWLTPQSPDDELRRVVLHEFGHALGMIHEHQNPEGGIQWNRAAVIQDLSGPPSNWDEATIENNMFKKYDPDEGTATTFDPDSIMLYPIPASWTTNGFSSGLNRELSPLDSELMRQVYPR